ncbi:hypothetical protein [Streptomyces sp. JB150]|uniref:hypothetical protein n=1 Tax=Streptomyces sp. JB150 TaxID=2714844 RepID=UPI00140ABC48|nr:hypothetical protein [Streptomyces sp. JB150]QIJ61111.1 hypothetical protein G7Z13_02990 [Streptomyces sp. JB150]
MDLEKITAVLAAMGGLLAALIGFVVGRWQRQGSLAQAGATSEGASVQAAAALEGAFAQAGAALEAVAAAAAKNHDQWRRSLRRDAYVAFLLATAEVEGIRYPVDDTEDTTLEARWSTAEEALNRARAAKYVLDLESPDMSQVAESLLSAVEGYTRAVRVTAEYNRAQLAMARIERDSGERLREAWRALWDLTHAVRSSSHASEEQRQRELVSAYDTARASLAQVERLTDVQRSALVRYHSETSEPYAALISVPEKRAEFLEAARQRLDAS